MTISLNPLRSTRKSAPYATRKAAAFARAFVGAAKDMLSEGEGGEG
jgi:hypothetical protein